MSERISDEKAREALEIESQHEDYDQRRVADEGMKKYSPDVWAKSVLRQLARQTLADRESRSEAELAYGEHLINEHVSRESRSEDVRKVRAVQEFVAGIARDHVSDTHASDEVFVLQERAKELLPALSRLASSAATNAPCLSEEEREALGLLTSWSEDDDIELSDKMWWAVEIGKSLLSRAGRCQCGERTRQVLGEFWDADEPLPEGEPHEQVKAVIEKIIRDMDQGFSAAGRAEERIERAKAAFQKLASKRQAFIRSDEGEGHWFSVNDWNEFCDAILDGREGSES